MKQKDIALIIVVIFFSAVIAIFVSKKIFNSPKNHNQKAEVVQPITADFPVPDKRYFNNQAFDPTKPITIQQNANSDPFSSTNTNPQ